MKINISYDKYFSPLPSHLIVGAVNTLRLGISKLERIKWPINAIALGHGWKNKEITHSKDKVLSDIDLFVISNFIPFFWKRLSAIGEDVEREGEIGFHYRGAIPFLFRRSKTFSAYRLKNETLVIEGDKDIFRHILAKEDNIPSREAVRTLFNTLVTWLVAATTQKHTLEEEKYLALRAYMNMGEAYLIHTGNLAPTYKQRQNNFFSVAKKLNLDRNLVQKIIWGYQVKTDYSFMEKIEMPIPLAEAKLQCMNVINDILAKHFDNSDTVDSNLDRMRKEISTQHFVNFIYYLQLIKLGSLRPLFLPLLLQFRITDLYQIAFYHETNQVSRRNLALKKYFRIDNFDDTILIKLFEKWPLPVTVEM